MTEERFKRKTPADFFKALESYDDFVYNVYKTNVFKKDVDLCYKGYKKKGNEVVMECHIQPDWLLIWEKNDTEIILILVDTGTHSDLFD